MLSKIIINHFEVESNIRVAREVLFWLGMKKANQDMCSTCGIVIAKLIPLPLLLWEIISQIFFAFEQQSYLVTLSHILDWAGVHELTNTLSTTIVNKQKTTPQDLTSHVFVIQTMDHK